MINFEEEIEVRLREFQRLTGKGNVKDCNQTLYEIIRLMLGMMAQNEATPRNRFDAMLDEDDDSIVPTLNSEVLQTIVPTAVTGEHIEISSKALPHPSHPTLVAENPAPVGKTAPHGLTKFGNPRRIRNKKKKSS